MMRWNKISNQSLSGAVVGGTDIGCLLEEALVVLGGLESADNDDWASRLKSIQSASRVQTNVKLMPRGGYVFVERIHGLESEHDFDDVDMRTLWCR
jgi:hypothetical protein